MREDGSNGAHLLLLSAAGLVGFVFVWFEWRLLFLAFAGLLVSIFLHAIASWVERRTPLNPALAYLLTLIALMGGATVLGLWLVPRVITQLSQVTATLPGSIHNAEAYLQQRPWGATLLSMVERELQGSTLRLSVVAQGLLHGTVDLVVVVVIGFFGALNPRKYRSGLLEIVSPAYRARAREIGDEIAARLRSWLLGQLALMAILGAASVIGLWLFGVPLAFGVGLLTGLLLFIPYLGSVCSGLLAVLLAFERGPHTALYVFLLYCGIHLLEGYLLTPFIQKKAALLPPILTILAQFFLWSFGGILGVAVAAPMAAAGLVLVKSLYLTPGSVQQ